MCEVSWLVSMSLHQLEYLNLTGSLVTAAAAACDEL